MLMPKRVKRRRVFRGRMKGKANKGNTVNYGQYGLVATQPAWITSNQIEAARIAMTRYIKRGGHVWIKIFPHKPVTEKPAETRMGSGKGSPEYWVAVVKPGRVMFEIAGVSEEIAKRALRLAAYKLPIKCKIAENEDFDEVAFSKISFKTTYDDIMEEIEGEESEGEESEGEESEGEEETGGEQDES